VDIRANVCCLCLGFSLSRFSVFALMVASIFSAASFLLCLVQGSTLAHSILLSLAIERTVLMTIFIGWRAPTHAMKTIKRLSR
jgi:hypothetical protein